MLVNVDHKYPLNCHQPECNNKKDMDSIDQLYRHLLFHEKHSEKLSSLSLTSLHRIVNQQPYSLETILHTNQEVTESNGDFNLKLNFLFIIYLSCDLNINSRVKQYV